MKICRIRKFLRKNEVEVTIRVNGDECERLSHAISHGMQVFPAGYPNLVEDGNYLLRQLRHEAFKNNWTVDLKREQRGESR